MNENQIINYYQGNNDFSYFNANEVFAQGYKKGYEDCYQNITNEYNNDVLSIFVRNQTKKKSNVINLTDDDVVYNMDAFIDELNGLSCYSYEFQEVLKERIIKKYGIYWQYLKDNYKKNKRLQSVYRKVSKLFINVGFYSCVSEAFDKVIFPNGLVNKQLYTLSAQSGTGKTSICVMMTAVLMSGTNPFLLNKKNLEIKRVLYFTLEQARDEIENRIISTLSFFNNQKNAIGYGEIMSPDISSKFQQFSQACNLFELFQDNVEIIDSEDLRNDLSLDSITCQCEKLFAQEPFDLIVVDQYTNIGGYHDNNDKIAKGLKLLANKFDVPIVVQAQMAKDALKNAKDKKGNLDPEKLDATSIKGSSELEHQSSAFLLLTKEENKKDEKLKKGITLVRFSTKKMRMGENNSLLMYFVGKYGVFLDAEEHSEQTEDTKKESNIYDEIVDINVEEFDCED